MENFEIMFSDLKPETQKEFLEFMGIKTPEEANYDVFPVALACNYDILD